MRSRLGPTRYVGLDMSNDTQRANSVHALIVYRRGGCMGRGGREPEAVLRQDRPRIRHTVCCGPLVKPSL